MSHPGYLAAGHSQAPTSAFSTKKNVRRQRAMRIFRLAMAEVGAWE
jgi:hypothetical protein